MTTFKFLLDWHMKPSNEVLEKTYLQNLIGIFNIWAKCLENTCGEVRFKLDVSPIVYNVTKIPSSTSFSHFIWVPRRLLILSDFQNIYWGLFLYISHMFYFSTCTGSLIKFKV